VPARCDAAMKQRVVGPDRARATTGGAKLLTIFSPGGFDQYLEKLVVLSEAQYADGDFMRALSERYDIFQA